MKYLAALLYRLIVGIRVFLYEKKVFRSRSLGHPVVSVGNLTVGGTGKTPYVAYLARLLQEQGYHPVVLSRGYRGKNRASALLVSDGKQVLSVAQECGDEAYLLARQLPGVPVLVGRKRFDAGRLAEESFEDPLFILDDGFQHLQLERDLDVLLIDGTDPFGGGKLLPAGRLREPVQALQRADLVVVTRGHLATEPDAIELRIRRIRPDIPIAYFYHDATALVELREGASLPLSHLADCPVMAVAAIGNPEVFLNDLAHYQFKVVARRLFRDHHPFSQALLDSLVRDAERSRAKAILTTEKDGVRLEGLEFPTDLIYALRIEARPESDPDYRKFIREEVSLLKANRDTLQ